MMWILCIFSALGLSLSSSQYIEKYKLSELSVLELSANKIAKRRHGPSVPELRCIGGSVGCYHVYPSLFSCLNRGFESDGTTVKWDCQVKNFTEEKLYKGEYRITNTRVTCEGYDNGTDPYVLIGSCSLDFTVDTDTARKERGLIKKKIFISLGVVFIFFLLCYIGIGLYEWLSKRNQWQRPRCLRRVEDDDDDEEGGQNPTSNNTTRIVLVNNTRGSADDDTDVPIIVRTLSETDEDGVSKVTSDQINNNAASLINQV